MLNMGYQMNVIDYSKLTRDDNFWGAHADWWGFSRDEVKNLQKGIDLSVVFNVGWRF